MGSSYNCMGSSIVSPAVYHSPRAELDRMMHAANDYYLFLYIVSGIYFIRSLYPRRLFITQSTQMQYEN